MKKLTRITSLMLALIILVPGISMAATPDEKMPTADISFIESVLDVIENEYPFEYDEEELILGGVKGMLQTLDPNSNYYTRDEARFLMETTEGEVVGIGIVMELKNGYVRVKEVLKGHPADKAGIKEDDVLSEVDGISIIGKTLPQISSMVKGDDGTEVKMKVNRDGKFLDFKLKREKIKINPVHHRIIDGEIGYVEIDDFTKSTSKYLKVALEDMEKRNINKLILDLRNNPGGLLYEAVNVSDLLLPEGDIVHIRRKSGYETIKSEGHKNKKYEMVVLVDGGTASASEIVAGAIQDRKLGVLVGTQTYGKGTVQNLLPITDGSIVKLTVAEYLTPNKISINKTGIKPDYEVENTKTEDMQYKKAIELLKNN